MPGRAEIGPRLTVRSEIRPGAMEVSPQLLAEVANPQALANVTPQ